MSEQVPEYYSDTFFLASNPWSVAITYSLSDSKTGKEGQDVCTVRMSHATAKTLTMLVRKQLKNYEKDTDSTIFIPPNVLNQLNLTDESW
jgi:hypothetical protein